MGIFFEDGDLMAHILGLGFIPYASELLLELHYSPSANTTSVALLYNWKEMPLAGPCNGTTRCDLSTFYTLVSSQTFFGSVNSSSQFIDLCGLSPS